MHATNDIARIDKAERIRFTLGVETDTREAACSPTRLDVLVSCKPSHPEEIDMLGGWILYLWPTILDVGMKDTYNSSIPVRVGVLNILV